MTTRNTDVNLIIRAKTEGEQAIHGLADAVEQLLTNAGDDKNIENLGRALAALDKAAPSLAAAQEKGSAAASKQAAAVHAASASIAEQKERVETLRRGLALLTAEADKAFVGPKRDGLKDTIRSAKGELTTAERQLTAFTSAYDRNLSGLRQTRSGLLSLTRTTTELGAAQEKTRQEIADTTQALQEQKDAAEAAARVTPTQARINGAAGIGRAPKSAAESASAFVSGGVNLDAQARALRDKLDPLAASQKHFNDELARYRTLAAYGKISTAELATAEHQLGIEADAAGKRIAAQGKVSLFGLKPYEFQNLSYQINDVVTGLASGQKITQIIAQQGGQILQLFPKVSGNILGFLTNPGVLTGVALFGAFALAIKRASDDAARLRQIGASLNFRADGDRYDARQLSEQQHALERTGASAEDAQKAINAFLDNSIAPEKIDQFSKAARATAQILGSDLPTAAGEVAKAFTGGYQAVAEFDNKLDFLTAAQREHIRSLFDQGRAEEARTEALNIYSGKAENLAQQQRGPWGDAALSLKRAWDSMVQSLSDIGWVRSVEDALAGLAGKAADAANYIDQVTQSARVAAAQAALAQVAEAKGLIDLLNTNTPEAFRNSPAYLERQTENIKRYTDAVKEYNRASVGTDLQPIRQKVDKYGKITTDNSGMGADTNSTRSKESQDRVAAIKDEDQLQQLRDAGQSRVLSLKERALRVDLAGRIAAKDAVDDAEAAAKRDLARKKEGAAIDREADARGKANRADREREIKQFEARVVGAEGGAGQNPFSTAAGFGQFTKGTFLDQFAKVFPSEARRYGGGTAPLKPTDPGAASVLALRQNESVARAIIDNYARENAKFLESFGAKVTAGNLYLAHFLGAGGAKAVLTAAPGAPVDQVLGRLPKSDQILSGNQGYLRLNGGKGRYRTAGELRDFIAKRVGDTGEAQTQGQVEIANLIEDAKKKQDDFNLSVEHGLQDRRDTVEALRAENGLYGVALLAEQRRAAVAAAERELRQKTEDTNKSLKPGEAPVVVTDEQVRAVRDAAGATFDLLHAREALSARRDDAQRPVDDLGGQIESLRQKAEFLRSVGDNSQAEAIDKQILTLTGDLQSAYDKLIEFYKALSPEERVDLGIVDQAQLDNVIAKLEQAKTSTQEWGKIASLSGKDVAQAFASNAASAFTNFINKVAAGKNVFKSLGDGIREFAATFISAIAQMIIQLLAYAAVVAILKALGVSVPNFGGGGSHASSHTGGIVGQGTGQRRNVSSLAFAGAQRFHTGGIVGLAPDEQAIIARKGEEVLTENNPRHRNNIGAGGGGVGKSGSVSVFNVFDMDRLSEQLLRSPAGEKHVINLVRDNQHAFKAALG